MTAEDAIRRMMGDPFLVLIFAVGVYGWWRLLARDSILDGPRRWFFHRWPHEGFTDSKERPKRGRSVYSSGIWYTQQGTTLGELVYCPFCLPWWIAFIQFGIYLHSPLAVMGLCLAHACRLLSGFLSKHL